MTEAEVLKRERAEKIALISAIPPDEMIAATIYLAERGPDSSSLSVLERRERQIENSAPVSDRIRKNGGLVREGRSRRTMLQVQLPASLALEAMSWPEVQYLSIYKTHWDVFEPFWDTESVGSMECPIIDGACPAYCHGMFGTRFDNADDCWSAERTLLVCVRGHGRGSGSTCDFKCNVNMLTGEFFAPIGGGPQEPEFLGWRKCTEREYDDRVNHATLCESPER